jgi:hypothetical protein
MEGSMKIKIFVSMFVVMFFSFQAFAQDTSSTTVEDIQICTSIEGKQPVGANTSFAKDVGQLYCFTKLSSNQDETSVSHVWYYNNKEMFKVELSTKAKTWRTWSVKKIPASMAGDWRVDVLSSDGKVLTSKQFTIQ